jgi:aromatic ring-opening dioxygenase catalytic subunit (LigB family)
MVRMPTYFVSHGGGPWPWMKDTFGTMFDKLEKSLQEMAPSLPERPKAILLVSAHWVQPAFTLSTHPNPPMYYDYSGFPEKTYQVKYPAPGSPVLAERVRTLLAAHGVAVNLDSRRGFDHGAFTVLSVAFPAADIPILQLSLQYDCDPAAHIELGRLLAPLRDEGILIIGSGMTYHNLRKLNSEGAVPSRQFDGWLQEAVTASSAARRKEQLTNWPDAPAARFVHPHPDHLLPLMVAVGAALDDPGTCVYNDNTMFGTITASSFRFSTVTDRGTVTQP